MGAQGDGGEDEGDKSDRDQRCQVQVVFESQEHAGDIPGEKGPLQRMKISTWRMIRKTTTAVARSAEAAASRPVFFRLKKSGQHGHGDRREGGIEHRLVEKNLEQVLSFIALSDILLPEAKKME